MLKRIVFLGTAAVLVASFAMTAIASGRAPRHRRHNVLVARTASDQPDQVIQWNQELQKVLVAQGAQPASIHPTRTLAITQIAVYDAVNGIVGSADPFLVDLNEPRSASPEAAAASAAHTVLDALLPSQQSTIDSFFQNSLAQIGSENVSIRAWPTVRRWRTPSSPPARTTAPARLRRCSRPCPDPGIPADAADVRSGSVHQTAHVAPFVLGSASQFRAPAPPALDSPEYATDFNQVESLGRLNSTTRTADQTAIGRFWGAAPIWIVWNQVADQAASAFGNSLAQNARLFAALDTTLADGAIALYDSKYAYHRWRPITAITAPDQGNPNTTADPTWVPLANTAPAIPATRARTPSSARPLRPCSRTSLARTHSRSR